MNAHPSSAGRPEDVAGVLTYAQLALLPMARMYREDGRHHVPLVVEVDREIDHNTLIAAMNILQDRHDALRQCFPEGRGTPDVRPRGASLGLDAVLELEHSKVDGALRAFIARPFDLASGPLWRAMLIRTPPARTIIACVFHHLVFDGASREVYLRELSAIVRDLQDGLTPDRVSAAWKVTDVAAWERAQASPARLMAAREWWAAHLSQSSAATALPPAPPRYCGQGNGSCAFDVGSDVIRSMRQSAHLARIPVAAVAIASVAHVLGAVTGQENIVVATPLMNRDHPRAAGSIGYLNRVLPLIVPTGPANAVAVGRRLLAANDHRHLPAAEIAAMAGPPMNRLLVAWQGLGEMPAYEGVPLRLRPTARVWPDFDLSVQFEAQGEALNCRIEWTDGTLGAAAATEFSRLLKSVLAGAELRAGPDAVSMVTAARTDPAVRAAAAHTDRRTGITTMWLELDEFDQTSASALRAKLARAGPKVLPAMRFETRATLPRMASGEVDIDRLVAGYSAAGRVVSPPESPLHCAIAEVWQRLLMTDDPVGIDDDFRDLGGHSLLAVRMLAEVLALAGRDRLTVAMASARTIRALAAAATSPDSAAPDCGLDPAITARLRSYTSVWRGSRHSATALIVGRNGSGCRVPLFWCLQSESELDALERHLGTDQPVFGMRSGYQVMEKSPRNIDRLAAVYASEIADVHPYGPLFIGGNCQAAVIAFEVARHVRASGREVDLLVMHEKMVPRPYDGRIALTFGRESDRNPYLAGGDPVTDFSRYFSGVMTIDLVAGSHGQFFQEPYVLELAATLCRLRDSVPTLRKD